MSSLKFIPYINLKINVLNILRPESLGIVPALIHLMAVISFQWIFRENVRFLIILFLLTLGFQNSKFLFIQIINNIIYNMKFIKIKS